MQPGYQDDEKTEVIDITNGVHHVSIRVRAASVTTQPYLKCSCEQSSMLELTRGHHRGAQTRCCPTAILALGIPFPALALPVVDL